MQFKLFNHGILSLSFLGVLPLGAELSQDTVKKLNLPRFTQAVTQPGRQIEGDTTNSNPACATSEQLCSTQ